MASGETSHADGTGLEEVEIDPALMWGIIWSVVAGFVVFLIVYFYVCVVKKRTNKKTNGITMEGKEDEMTDALVDHQFGPSSHSENLTPDAPIMAVVKISVASDSETELAAQRGDMLRLESQSQRGSTHGWTLASKLDAEGNVVATGWIPLEWIEVL